MHRGCAKRLLEELLPISRLGLHMKQPGLQVYVEAFEDYGPLDGRIEITGFRSLTLGVQVTCDFTYTERLRMELMSSAGCVPGSGAISKNRKTGQIQATTAAIGIDEHYERTAKIVRNLSLKKAAQTPIGNTALLIAFDEVKISGAPCWQRLFAALDRIGGLAAGGFAATYLFNGASNEIQRA